MLRTATVAIGRQTAGELMAELAHLGARLMVETLGLLPLQGTAQPTEGVTYAHKIDKAEARIDWALPATGLDRLVRAMQPSPGAWFDSSGARVKLIAAEPADGAGPPGSLLPGDCVATGQGALRLLTVQPEGRPRMPAADWLRGRRLQPGSLL
jgi:methionyl-tRNA formyltransferase